MKKFALLFGAFLTMFFASCDKKDGNDWADGDTGTVALEFDSRFGNQDLAFNTEYTTAQGEKVKFTKYNFFISNVKFYNEDGTVYTVPQDESYFLVKEDVAASHELEFENVPAGNYTHVEFMVGVDSLRNTKDVSERKGALDVGGEASDMYWSWNSGYIFFKIEGTSPAAPLDSATQTNPWWYHIGGFGGMTSATINNIKTLKIAVPADNADGSKMTVRKDVAPHIHMYADASKLFDGPTALKIAERPAVMFAPFSTEISKNFSGIFSIDHVHQ